jgi:DNA-binding CsgD family transcriptional regulator
MTPGGLEHESATPWPLPQSLRDSVLLRMSALSPSAQRLAERAAVMGPRLDLRALESLAEDPADVDRLIEASWIFETAPGEAAFRHALLREVIYGQIPWSRRRQWHAACAERLQATGGPPELLAEHWLAAREPERARAALLEVVDRAWRMHAYADAASQAVRALEQWPEKADEDGRLALLERLGECAQLADSTDGALRAWRELAERAERASMPQRAARAHRHLALLHARGGDFERSVDEYERAGDAFDAAGQRLDAGQAYYAAAETSGRRNRLQRALALLDRVDSQAGPADDAALHALARSLRGRALARAGRVDEGLAVARDALAYAQAQGLASVLGLAYQRLADCHEQAGDYVQARNIFLAGADWCAIHRQPDALEACKACALPVLEQCGEWDLCLQLAAEVRADPAAPPWTRVMAQAHQGKLLACRGEHAAARPLLLGAVEDYRRLGLATGVWVTRALLALDNWWLGRPQAARDEAYAALAAAADDEEHHHVLSTLGALADVFRATGDHEGLDACLHAAVRAVRANPQPEALATLALVQGDLQWVLQRHADALSYWQTAVASFDGLPLPLARARVMRRLGEARAATGVAAGAAVALREAVDGFGRLGCQAYLREATLALRQLAPTQLNAADERQLQAGLTPRQLQILALVARGLTDKTIARDLKLSPRTVEMHVARLLATLGCRTRAEAVRRGSELGLIVATVGKTQIRQ